MPLLPRVRSYWRNVVHRSAMERQMADELHLHLTLRAQDLERRGHTPEEACRLARLEFGSTETYKEEARASLGLRLLDELRGDLRYAARTLRRSAAFTTASVTTLALAIGAVTAMFSVLDAVLLRPLPHPSPDQLTMLWVGMPGQNARNRAAFGTVTDWRLHSRSFAAIAVFDPGTATLANDAGAERIGVARVSPNYFPLLGIQAERGRTFSNADAEQRREVALIGHAFWQSRFGGSPDAVGASIVLDGRPRRIIGVLPRGAGLGGDGADVWEPHTLFPDWETRRATRTTGSWFVIARLRPNVTIGQAQAEMTAIAGVLDEQLPAADRGRGVIVEPLSLYVVGPRPRLALWMLMGAVCGLLLIAAANVASLSLARAVGRAREMAVRTALGARPFRIARQLVAESVLLAAIAGTAGAWVALAAVSLTRVLGPQDVPRLDEATLDARVLALAIGVSLLTGLVTAVAPGISVWRSKARYVADSGGRTASDGVVMRRVRRALVVAEFALAIALMTGAGLLIRSWQHVTSVDPGFRPERILFMNLATNGMIAPPQRVGFYSEVLEGVGALPGVESAALIGDLFVSSDAEPVVTFDGQAGITSRRLRLRIDEVSEKLFTTVQTPLLAGRFFSREDGPDAPPVAIVNETLARRLWRRSNAVGRTFKLGPPESDRDWMTIVGVVADMRRQGLEIDPIPQVFVPLAQQPSGNANLLVRTAADDPMSLAAAVRGAVGSVEARVPLYAATTLEDRLGRDLAQRRFQTSLVTAFSVAALLIAAAGVYGLVHYSVSLRTKEIAVRMALGAARGGIFRMILGEGLQLTTMGLVLGLVAAWLVGRAASGLLFGVAAADPLTFATVSLVLLAAGAAACCFPAHRATTIDPASTLQHV